MRTLRVDRGKMPLLQEASGGWLCFVRTALAVRLPWRTQKTYPFETLRREASSWIRHLGNRAAVAMQTRAMPRWVPAFGWFSRHLHGHPRDAPLFCNGAAATAL